MKDHLGEIIAERHYHIKGDKSNRVSVLIGVPRKRKGTKDFRCPYFVTGLCEDRILEAAGVDSYQALMSAFTCIQAEIDFLNRTVHGGKIRWLDDDNTDLMNHLHITKRHKSKTK